jgi:hypothetical protein
MKKVEIYSVAIVVVKKVFLIDNNIVASSGI